MTHLVFFEKPGCGGNARQRATLQAAGHTLERRNLLTAHWTREAMLSFMAPLPVADWFNRSAPRIKSGEIVPEALSPDQAIDLLLTQPLLIRRPLMQRADDGSRHVGFEHDAVHAWVGLNSTARPTRSLEACPSTSHRCAPAEATTKGNRHAAV